MGVYQSGADDMQAFAKARVAEAERVMATHQSDDTGCCVECGRAAPCTDETAASQTREHYQAWIASVMPPPPVEPPSFDDQHRRLIRPYVLRILRRDGR